MWLISAPLGAPQIQIIPFSPKTNEHFFLLKTDSDPAHFENILTDQWFRHRRQTRQEAKLVYHAGNSVSVQERNTLNAHVNHVTSTFDEVDHNANATAQKNYTVLNTSMASSGDKSSRKPRVVMRKQHLVANSHTLPPAPKSNSDIYIVEKRGRVVSSGQASARSESRPPSTTSVYKVHTMKQGQTGKKFLMLEPTSANVRLSRSEAQKLHVHNWVKSQPATNHRAMSEEILMAGMNDRRENGHDRRHQSEGTSGPLIIEGRISTDQYARPHEIALSADAVDHSGRKVAVEPAKNDDSVLNCTPDPQTTEDEKNYVRWSPRMRKKGDKDVFIPGPEPEMTSQSSFVIASGTLTMPHGTEKRRPSPIQKPVGTLPVSTELSLSLARAAERG